MNVNPLILELKNVTGLPVVPDIYDGHEDKWITFTYEDERANMYGDNVELYSECTIQVALFTPQSFNYFPLKKTIKKALIERGFQIEYMKSWVNNSQTGTERIRQTVFVVNKVELTQED